MKADPASEGTEESHPVPGSPEPDEVNPVSARTRALHPVAWLVSLALVGVGLALATSWIDLAIAGILFGILALRAERKSLRAETPLLALALIVFLAHVLFAGKQFRAALAPSAAIACRLLALLYLLRWAARSALGPIARWLMAQRPPSRPRVLLVLAESARLTAGLLPLAIREAEQHVQALRGRGIRPGRGLQGTARYLLAWFLPFLGTMLRVGDAYADALTARGYRLGHARNAGIRLHWGIREWAAVAGSATGAAWFLRVL